MTALQLKSFAGTKTYDTLAVAPVIAYFSVCVWYQAPHLLALVAAAWAGPADALSVTGLLAKAASLIFIMMWMVLLLIRRTPMAKAPGLVPRIAAIAGSFLGVAILTLPARELPWQLYALSTLLILGGTIFSIYAVIRLGRSVSLMAEARRLVTDGPYAMIRHPLYLGEGIALLGIMLQYVSPFALFLFALQCAFQLVRMRNEEQILGRTFPDYAAYMARTARLIPGIY